MWRRVLVYLWGFGVDPGLLEVALPSCPQLSPTRAYGCAQEWYILRLRRGGLGVESVFVRQADFRIVSLR